MFLDESAFDEPEHNPPKGPPSKYISNDSGRPGTGHFSRPSTGSNIMVMNDVDEEEIGSPAVHGRARILAEQRELQLKRRQSSLNGGAMMRSSQDGPLGSASPARPVNSQLTPAAPAFSRPKNLRDEHNEVTMSSEFGKAERAAAVNKAVHRPRYDDDEDDGRPPRGHSRTNSRANNNSTQQSERDDYDSRGKSRSNNNRRNDDTEEDSDYGRGNSRNSNSRSPKRGDPRDSRDNDRGNSSRGRRDDDRDDGWNNANNKRGYDSRDDDSRERRGGGGGGGGRSRDDRYNSQDNDSDYDRNNGRRSHNDDRSRSKNSRSPVRDNKARNDEWNSDNDNKHRNYRSGGGADDRGFSRSPTKKSTSTPSRNKNRRDEPVEDEESAPMQVDCVPPDYSNMRHFLTSPLPKNNGILQCYIRRNKSGTNKLYPIYSLYLKEGDVFLMASRKRPKNKTSNYLISLDQNDLNRSGPNYLGKLRSNFVGTEFQIFDNGVNPKDMEPDEVAHADASVRCELGSVMYAANVLGSRGPRKMQVAMPGLDSNNQITKWKDTSSGGEGDMLTRMKDRNFRDLVYLINKPPRWNEQVGAYVLNFNGRVTMASVKNFQLVDPDEQNAVVLQFGRVGKDEFTMDFQYPISPFQAFAVTLSSFDSKIACD